MLRKFIKYYKPHMRFQTGGEKNKPLRPLIGRRRGEAWGPRMLQAQAVELGSSSPLKELSNQKISAQGRGCCESLNKHLQSKGVKT